MNSREVLALPMGENDASASTVREYLTRLLLDVWKERECFNGKRPFGNSGWQYEIYHALARGGAIVGEFDEDELVVTWEELRKADEIIDVAIDWLGREGS